MLKTYTVLATVPAHLTAETMETQIQRAIVCYAPIARETVRVDAFDGDFTWSHPDSERPGAPLATAREAHKAMLNPPKPRTWADLTRDEQYRILKFANEHGGGFVSTLADAWWRADSDNAAKLGEAFGAMLLESYGHALNT